MTREELIEAILLEVKKLKDREGKRWMRSLSWRQKRDWAAFRRGDTSGWARRHTKGSPATWPL